MERQSGKEKLVIQVGIGLIAGTFSIIPVASGAPVLDKVVSGGATVNTGVTTKVNSTTRNNVIDWKDFSVAKGEKIQFDSGARTNNYLNIVTGSKLSQVDGAIEGGANVYLVNPNGVIFGKTASVDVGNLYVSTRKISDVVSSADLAEPTAVLASSGTSSAAGDIVNLGKIQANAVVAEGKNIKFLNTADVTDLSGAVNTNVTLISNQGTIGVGERAAATSSNALMASNASSTSSARASYNTLGGTLENYTLITNQTELQGMSSALAGKYYLGNDITCSGTYVPVGTAAAPFTGVFDGQYFTVAKISVSGQTYGGLFGYLNGATVKNVGVVNANVSASYAGGIAGYAKGSTLINVYNDGGAITPTTMYQGGGIVGGADSTTINSAYNTGTVSKQGGGIVGFTYGGVTIKDVYNTASLANGIAVGSRKGSLAISNAYTVGSLSSFSTTVGLATSSFSNVSATDTYKKSSTYSGWDISNVGGENTVWRIYEGQTLPLLRAFLTANGTVTANYNYTQGTKTGANNGADVKSVYNSKYLIVDQKSVTFDSTVTGSISYDTTGIRNVSDGTKAMIWTGQNGYDLVGTNATITARPVTVTTDLSTVSSLTKEYDGTTDAAAAVKNLYYGTEGSDKGILEADSADTSIAFSGSANYDSSNVGTGKTITVAGSVTIAGNSNGNYALYKSDGTAASTGSISLNGTVKNSSITQKSLVVSFADGKGTGLDKVYDGTTTVTATDGQPSASTFALAGIVSTTDVSGTKKAEDVGLSYDATANYTSKNAGDYTNKVGYGGLKLTGTTAGNYILKDASGKVLYDVAINGVGSDINKTTGGTLYGSGTISPKALDVTGFSWYKDITDAATKQTATREYDAQTSYTNPTSYKVRSDSMPSDDLSFTVTSADFITASDGTSKTTTKNVSDAKGVLYQVSVSGADASNYTINGTALKNGGTTELIGEGSITPRTINLAVTGAQAVKTYDGDASVKVNGKTAFSLAAGYVTYADASDTAHQLIAGDDNQIVINGQYQSTNGEAASDVNYSGTSVLTKNVAYTASVVDASNAASSNYTLVMGGKSGTTLNGISGTGRIDQKELTGITFGDVSKTYDTKSDVLGDQTTDQITVTGLTGLASGDSVSDVISVNTIKGNYGSRSGSNFTASADVLRDASNKVTSKDVQYTGVSKSMTGTKAHNYTLGTLSDTQYGKGTINPLTISSADALTLERTSQAITKVYDGNTDVAHDNVTANAYVDKLYATVGSTKVYFDYTVNDADYATRNSKNSGAQDVTYKLNVAAGNGNFEIADTALTKGVLEKTFANAGIITPKNLTATVVNNNITKTYDATTDVIDAAGKEMTGDALVTLDGLVAGDGASNATTAVYDSKNAGARTVNYTLALTGGEDATNYRLVDSTGASATSISGGGTINKRELTVTTITPQTKVYDGNSDLKSSLTAGDFALSDGTTGNAVLSKDGITLDASKISGHYGAGNTDAAFKASPNVQEVKTVGYSGLQKALGDAALANYTISDTAYGTGSITPATITAQAFHFSFDDVSREYDATEKVGAAADTFVRNHYVLLPDGTKSDFNYSINSADYISAGTTSAGTAAAAIKDVGTQKTVSYKIAVDPVSFANYNLDSSVSNVMTFTAAGAGTITPKAVYAKVVSDNLTKTYDGTENLRTGNKTWSGDTATGTDLSGDSIIKLEGLITGDGAKNASTGSYDGAGVGSGNKTITYNVAIDDAHAGNYVIYADGDQTKTALTTLKTTTNTINPYGLELSFDPVKRAYDGTTTIDSALVKSKLGDSLKGDTVSLAAGYTANYIDPNVKTVNASTETAVNYDGLKLTGADAANYMLVNSNGTALAASTDVAGTQIMTGRGTMDRFVLTGNNVTFSFNPISKEYDATNVVKYNDATTSEALRNYLKDHYVTLDNGTKQDIVADVDSAVYSDVNHGVGKTVTFKMSLNGDNYDFSDLQKNDIVDAAGKFKAQTTNGDISVRKIYASLTDNPADRDIVKTYDGTSTVLQDTTGKVTFRDGDLLTSLDGVTLDTANINARYADANAGAKSVYYDVRLNGDTAGNYEIHDLTKKETVNDVKTSLLTGTGTINKALLTVSYGRQEKTYDGTADIKEITPTLSGMVNGESLAFNDTAKSKISGQYGSKDTKTQQFTTSKDVSRDAAGNVIDKGVYYTGAADALQSMVDQGNTIARNYTIDNTAYFNEAKGKGRILPLAITQKAVADWKPVTKEYDTTTAVVPSTLQKDALSLSVTGTVENTPIILDYTVGTAKYDNKNVGTDHKLAYTITAVNQNLGNYQLSDDAAAAITGTTWISNADNSITPHHIKASLTNTTDVTKVYDGTVASNTGNLVVDKDDASMLQTDGVNAVITAAYGDKNATIDPGAAHTNSKTVTYTLGLGAVDPNYVIDQDTYTATGDIERRTVYADFTNGSNTGMDKTYDGNRSVADGYRDRIGLVSADGTTGVVDHGIELIANSISAAYQSPDVKRDSTGKVTTQDVYFSNFNIKDTNTTDGDDAGNYIVRTTDGTGTLTGNGTISPRTINVSVKQGPVKEYDGTTAIEGGNYVTAANINVDRTNLVANDTINVGLGSAPSYQQQNAGTGIAYTYDLNWDNSNYELAVDTAAAGQSLSKGGLDKSGKLTATLAGSNGTITKRVLTVESITAADKVYDGTTGVNNAAANIVLNNRVISGDTIGLAATAAYEGTDASSSESSNELIQHKVDYQLTLANDNYQLSDTAVQGQGIIRRKGLDIVANSAAVDAGLAMPTFSGKVNGLIAADGSLADKFTFQSDSTVTTQVPGIYGVYGWYGGNKDGRTSGNLGNNYTFSQASSNDTAFTVNFVKPTRDYGDTINPKNQFTPDGTAYQQASKDKSGTGIKGDAALEYRDASGRVMGGKAGTDSSAWTKIAQIGVGAGNVVNLSSADVANAASVKIDSSGTVVNLEIIPVSSASADRQASAAIESTL